MGITDIVEAGGLIGSIYLGSESPTRKPEK